MVALFPGLPRFVFFGLRSVQYMEVEEREKRGRPGLIHHVNDARWMPGGHENDVSGRGPIKGQLSSFKYAYAWSLDRLD